MPEPKGNNGSVKHGEKGSRHSPERGDRNIPSSSDGDRPTQLHIGDDGSRRGLKAVKELVEGRFHLGDDGFAEGLEVGGLEPLRRDDVSDGGEAEIWRRGIGADEGEPLFGDDEGDENMGLR